MRSRRPRYISQRAATATSASHNTTQVTRRSNDIEPFGSGGGLVQRASKILLLVGVGVMQVLWVGLLAYAGYVIWQRLPL